MRGDFKIDGTSAYDTYGVFVLKGGYNGVYEFPQLKSREAVDWLDEDGLDIDLSVRHDEAKQISISFGFKDINRLSEFYQFLSSAHSHSFNFLDIGRTTTLRLASSGNISSLINAGAMTLSFYEDSFTLTEDDPLDLGESRVSQRGFTLDGIDLSRYGCWVLDGTLQSLRQMPAIKQNLTISSAYADGQTYYGQTRVQYASKDLTMYLLINARDVDEFKQCLGALRAAIATDEEQELDLGLWASGLKCTYKSMRVSRFEVCQSGTFWFEFSLVFTLLDYRPEKIEGLLAREENGYYVTTEDGELIHISTT